jgi:hypothetical protein
VLSSPPFVETAAPFSPARYRLTSRHEVGLKGAACSRIACSLATEARERSERAWFEGRCASLVISKERFALFR